METRAVVGHWEGDLINGATQTGNLVTAVDPPAPRDAPRQAGRNTRFTPAGRTDTKEAEEVMAVPGALFRQVPPVVRTGLTLDNGKEFACHEEPARTTDLDVFFARPCHSWERGTNENTNGLIRRLHPKRSSFARIGQAELRRIDRYLNDRPRRCPGWRTPREVMAAFLASRDLQRGKQRRGSVTLIVMRHRSAPPLLEGQARPSAIQGLNSAARASGHCNT